MLNSINYMVISHTNAPKSYNYIMKKSLMLFILQWYHYSKARRMKKQNKNKKKPNTHSSNSRGCQFPAWVKTSQIFQTKVGGSSKLPALLTAAVTNTFMSSLSTIGLIFVCQHKLTNFNVLTNACVLSFEFSFCNKVQISFIFIVQWNVN